MNRRSFLKSATVALTALALGIKSKINGEIVTGVGRGSPQLIDNSGAKAGDILHLSKGYHHGELISFQISSDGDNWVDLV
jgi:hypothetical protein